MVNINNFDTLVSRNEIRRLEKAAKDKNKNALNDWLKQFEIQLRGQLYNQFEESYKSDVADSIDNLCAAVAYTCMFSEVSTMDKDQVSEFMEDMFVTVDMFRRGEYIPDDYIKELEENGVTSDKFKSKTNHTNILTIIGPKLNKDGGKYSITSLNSLMRTCESKGYTVFYTTDDLEKLKYQVHLSDALLVLDLVDLDNITKQFISNGIATNKEIIYLSKFLENK